MLSSDAMLARAFDVWPGLIVAAATSACAVGSNAQFDLSASSSADGDVGVDDGGADAKHLDAGGPAPCASPMRRCADFCVDLTSDRHNCGACGRVCSTTEKCIASACAADAPPPPPPPECPDGQTKCSDGCQDLTVNTSHCGACDSACGLGATCVAGACDVVCSGGTTKCTSGCAKLKSDHDNCGACDHACADTELCILGICWGV